MTTGSLGEVQVGIEAETLEILNLFGRERVVEVFGDDIRVGIGPRPGHFRGQNPAAADDLANSGHEGCGKTALGNLFAQLSGLLGFENIVEVAEECTEGQTHGSSSGLAGEKSPAPEC